MLLHWQQPSECEIDNKLFIAHWCHLSYRCLRCFIKAIIHSMTLILPWVRGVFRSLMTYFITFCRHQNEETDRCCQRMLENIFGTKIVLAGKNINSVSLAGMGINDSDLMRLSFLLKEKTPGRSSSKNLHFKMILCRVYTKHHSSRGLFTIGTGQSQNWFIYAWECEYNK